MIKIDNRKYSWIILFSVVIAILLTVAVNEPTHAQDAVSANRSAKAAAKKAEETATSAIAAKTAAKTAKKAAETAKTAAKTAKKAAEKAKTAASTIAANDARISAKKAQTAAEKAEKAQIEAEKAEKAAKKAAEKAQTEAETAAGKAQTAAEKAENAAKKAQTAAEKAENAAKKAKTEANRAVETAQKAAQTAQTAQKAAQTAQTAAQTAQTAQTAAGAALKSNKTGILPLQYVIIAVLILLLIIIIYLVFNGILSDKKKQITSLTNSEIALRVESPTATLKKSIQTGATIPSVTNVTRNIDTTPNDPTSKFNETLTQWWTANATKSSSECIKGLTEKFGEESNPDGENEHQGQFDKYKVLTVTAGTKQFLIPCKDIVYDDFITKFFCVDGDSYITGSSLITSLIRPAIKDSTGKISRGMLDVTPPSVGSEPIRQPVITEPKRPVLDDKKLIDWWNKNSTSELTKCKNSLEERFGNEIFVELISRNENSEEDWYVIGITEPLSEEVYVLPRQRTLIGNIQVWFDTSNKISKLTLIKSLVKTARSAKGSPKKVKKKGVITIED